MPTPRFLTLDDVAEILNVSWSQAYALVRRKELLAIQIGGRGQWRVEVDELERFIQRKYAEARAGTEEDGAEHEQDPQDQPEVQPPRSTDPPRNGPGRQLRGVRYGNLVPDGGHSTLTSSQRPTAHRRRRQGVSRAGTAA